MFCPKCGNEIPDQAVFCPKCGAAVSTGKSAASPGSSTSPADQAPAAQGQSAAATAVKPKKKSKIKILLPVAAAIILLAAVSVFGGSSTPEDDRTGEQTEYLTENQTGEEDPVQGGAEDEVPSPEAELLAIIDYVDAYYEETVIKAAADDSEDSNTVEECEQSLQAILDFLTELEKQCELAKSISGLDAKLKAAGNEYFNMLGDSTATLGETYMFLRDFMELDNNIISHGPAWSDYDTPANFSKALSAWVQELKAGCESFSCPPCIEIEWEQYKANLMYSESVARKMALSNPDDQTVDWLRFLSARAMMSRSYNTDGVRYNKLMESVRNERSHATEQMATAISLEKEMHNYVEMAPEEREAYTFKNIRTGELVLDYDVTDTIYPSLYNTYDAFAVIRTGCISGSHSIVVEAEIEGFTQKYIESFDLGPFYQAIYIKPPALTGELNLSSAKSAQLKITISEKDGTLIEAKSFPVMLKSKYDFEWYSDEYGISTQDNILCFLTPEAKAINDLKVNALGQISKMTGGTVESFWGYQSMFNNPYADTYLQAAGLMSALNEMGVRYVMDPFTVSGSNQHILFPEDVLENRSGLCIETSLVIASALQSAGMHAFLIFPPGHAQVAVEVWNRGSQQGEYFLIETTILGSESNNLQHYIDNANGILNENTAPTGIITYYSSDEWYDYLKTVEHIVDCDDSRVLGMTPFAN